MSESEKRYGHVVQCDIDDKCEAVITLRKGSTWFYLTANPKDIRNEQLRKDYVNLAEAARTHKEVMERMITGEYNDRDRKRDIEAAEKVKDTQSQAKDSGYGSDSPADADSQQGNEVDNEKEEGEDDDVPDPTEVFQEWVQEPLLDELEAAAGQPEKELSLTNWYQTDIKLFSLKCGAKDQELSIKARDDLDGEKYIEQSLVPSMSLPKYIKEMDGLRWYSPDDIMVQGESHDVHLPIHPTLVRIPAAKTSEEESQTCFLKLASSGDEKAVKREIKFLRDMEQLGLYDKGIRAPRLQGVVTVPNKADSHEQILGFLLTLIPQPCTPMTKLMSSDIAESKRSAWAKGMEDMLSILHEHKLIWGDAKGDNFVVDKNDELWIIDFGGSFTVGWIEPRYADTKKGDRMGTQKIVDGILHPESEEEEEEEEESNEKDDEGRQEEAKDVEDDEHDSGHGNKRKRSADADDDREEHDGDARRKARHR